MNPATNIKKVKVPIYSEYKNGVETVNFDIKSYYELNRKAARGSVHVSNDNNSKTSYSSKMN
jgi:hypothetical protein